MTFSRRVLVVEDDHALAYLLEIMLREERADVRVAATLRQARALLAEFSFDAILCDFNLPDGLGTELLDEPDALRCHRVLWSADPWTMRDAEMEHEPDARLDKIDLLAGVAAALLVAT